MRIDATTEYHAVVGTFPPEFRARFEDGLCAALHNPGSWSRLVGVPSFVVGFAVSGKSCWVTFEHPLRDVYIITGATVIK